MKNRFINVNLEDKICSVDMIAQVLSHISKRETKVISFINPFSYALVAKDQSIVRNVDYWFCDGSLMCKLTNLRRKVHIKRASFDFSSIASNVLSYAEQGNFRIAFIGATQDEIDLAITNIKLQYPLLNIVYFRNGYLKFEQFSEVVDDLLAQQVELLIVGTGTPHQEKLSIYCKEKISSGLTIFTCGGFLTQTSIKADYYHPLIKKTGLRWLQRAFMHSHVRKRLLVDYPLFTIRYIFNR